MTIYEDEKYFTIQILKEDFFETFVKFLLKIFSPDE